MWACCLVCWVCCCCGADKPSDKYYKAGVWWRWLELHCAAAQGVRGTLACARVGSNAATAEHLTFKQRQLVLLYLRLPCLRRSDPRRCHWPHLCRLQAAKIAKVLAKDVHYTVDEKQRNVLLTEEGYEAAEDVLQVGAVRYGAGGFSAAVQPRVLCRWVLRVGQYWDMQDTHGRCVAWGGQLPLATAAAVAAAVP